MTIIIVIAVLAVLVLWVVSVQNKLVKLDEFCKNALKQINVQQITRFDALKTMVQMAREYAKDVESKTIIEAVEARNINRSANPSAGEINQNEKMLADTMRSINVVVEKYPELKSMDLYTNAQKNYTQNEEQVRMSRMVFNDTVTKFNTACRMFPGNIVAGMLGFGAREYLEEDKSKTDIPDIFPAK